MHIKITCTVSLNVSLATGHRLVYGQFKRQLKPFLLAINWPRQILTVAYLSLRNILTYSLKLFICQSTVDKFQTWSLLFTVLPSQVSKTFGWYYPDPVQIIPPLESAQSSGMGVPHTKTNYSDRSFGDQGPGMWNSIPTKLRAANISLDMFRNRPKSFC